MKLPNGYGSITKLKGKRRKPYIVRVTTNYDDNGKQIRKVIGYASNRTNAMEILSNFSNNPFNVNYKDYRTIDVFKKWLPTQEKLVKNKLLSDSSLTSYKNAFYNHCTSLHEVIFSNIKAIDIQNIIDNMNGSNTLKKYVKFLFSKLFQFAMDDLEMPISKNYALKVIIPNEKKSTKHKSFTEKELSILWDNIDKVSNLDTILIMCYTSLRPSELLNVKKKNVYLKDKYMIAGGKTKAGKDRIIPIHDRIFNLLKKRYINCNEFLIEKNNNKISYRYYLEYIWNPIINQLNFDNTPHDCRHTFATRMDNVEANKICIKLIMGHSISDITDGTYTHKSIENLLKEINKIT